MTTDTTPKDADRAALWKLVPVTPTPEMMTAFYREWERGQWSENDWTPVFHRAYKTALAASPPPPAVEAQELIDEHMRLVDELWDAIDNFALSDGSHERNCALLQAARDARAAVEASARRLATGR